MGKLINNLGDLTPDPRNARLHNPRNVGMIEAALHEVGAARSIVIDEDGVVLAGNATIEAAAQAGIERVQVVDADGETIIAVRRRGLTPEQKTKLALFDNRTAELAEWDAGVLSELATETDLSQLFRPDELAALLAETPDMGGGGDEEGGAPNFDQPTEVQPGDVWQVGRHTVACLDSTEPENLDRVLAGRTPAMVWADPPYGIDFDPTKERGKLAPSISRPHVIGDETTETARAAVRLCLAQFGDAIHAWWGANNYADELPPSECWIVWDKENGTNDFADIELAWTNIEGAARLFRHMWNGMLKDSERGEQRVHATQKPIALAEWFFSRYGSAGDLILDPFLGSGPSLKAAEQSGRTVVGFELSPHYCDHILNWARTANLTCTRVGGE